MIKLSQIVLFQSRVSLGLGAVNLRSSGACVLSVRRSSYNCGALPGCRDRNVERVGLLVALLALLLTLLLALLAL